MQLVKETSATTLSTVGMASDCEYSEMKRKGQMVYDKGPAVYCLTIISIVVMWQLCFMGTAGIVFLTSSLTEGIYMRTILAMNVIGGLWFTATALAVLRLFQLCFVLGAFALVCIACNFIEVLEIEEDIEVC
ncbi:probable purine permease 4 [Citrus clementina]|uniref:probable purine permease 4 n=1 Tax=Citrus clementina TaxID=85681 RepID=UPI000CED0836|nr:probable purine permease 4 [Citrus x clementina]